MIRIGLAGCSGHYSSALDVIAKDPELRLVGFAKTHPLEETARAHKHPAFQNHTRTCVSIEELLEQELDLLIVDAIYGLHGSICLQAAKRGIGIYCEKPVATSLEELELLERLVTEYELPFGCMLDTRTHPLVQQAKVLIHQGAIGEVALAYGQKTYRFGRRPSWYNDPLLYGGTILWVAIHAIDWTRYVTGKEFSQVQAHSQNLLPDYPNLDSSGTLQFEFVQGGSAVISYDFFRPLSARTHGDDRLRIVGTKGSVEARLDEGFFELVTDSPPTAHFDDDTSMFTRFAAYLKGQAPAPIQAWDIFETTRWALCAQLSTKLNQPIKR
ncbi:MAG: Gfo/Idh/MocA family oxidoreductase [Limnochordia bacterium]|jgi:predicted dehydrogenase|nr:Gfo/Idh/MocA family oxidoreductase [Limnochordia bacterium]MDD2629987.1 Gfo/Idh/MocA family oxidoreductase [Limnochordia bacterium]MDD4517922.1 Gfo/Idh/MocA family oxidoreductase [Limnochordia bacterium]